MSVERIRELLALMAEHDLCELELSEGDFSVSLRKTPPPQVIAQPMMPQALPGQLPQAAPPTPAPNGATRGTSEAEEDSGYHPITSPLVGTFYNAPAPGADPYVAMGDQVDSETVVCIVEAMKVMNEVRAGCRGVVRKTMIDNGEAVEFGQVLFLVEE